MAVINTYANIDKFNFTQNLLIEMLNTLNIRNLKRIFNISDNILRHRFKYLEEQQLLIYGKKNRKTGKQEIKLTEKGKKIALLFREIKDGMPTSE